MPFNTNVFINCPFDNNYKPLLKPLLFTIILIRLEPKISETKSSGDTRVEQIKKLIKESNYSIHDISRCEAMQPEELPRFNMPFELGLDIGAQTFGHGKLKEKKCLILEKEKFRYQAVLSDIAGQDIKAHENNPQILIRQIIYWFENVLDTNLPAPNKTWEEYNIFIADLTAKLFEQGKSNTDIAEMPHSTFIRFVKEWIQNRPV